MNWTLTFLPVVPLWLIGIFAVLGVAVVALALVFRVRGSLLRTCATLVLLLALLNPVLRDEDREVLSDVAVVVVDQSPSQSLLDRTRQTEIAEEKILEQIEKIPNLDVRVVKAGRSNPEQGNGTRLFSALDTALVDVPPDRFAGAIMITDGQVHDATEANVPLATGAPIHGVISGHRNEGDRRIVIEQAPRFGIVGQQQEIVLRVEDSGALPRRDVAKLTVSVDGKVTEIVQVDIGQPVTIPLDIDHGGPIITELVAEGVDGELSLQNNRALITTQGIRDRLRVLLVSGEPHTGERTWRNLLKADAAVDLVHFTILRPPEKQDGTPIKELSLIAFPTRELFSIKLDEFDLIVFDRYQRRGVLPLIYLSNVANFVQKGGAILSAAGPAFASPLSLYRTPLSAVLPGAPTGSVTTVPFRPQITDQGRRHPVTRALPGGETSTPTWGRWFRLIDVESSSGHTVMSGPDNKPLMILERKGEGRVAQLLSDHAWLWARGYDGGGPQSELLRRLAHWLMKEPDLEEEALSASHKDNQLTIERRTMLTKTPQVTVTAPSGKSSTMDLKQTSDGIWRGGQEIDEIGVYQLTDGIVSSVVAVGSTDPKEYSDIRATGDKLKPIADQTNGGIHWLASRAGQTASLNIPRIRMTNPGRRSAGSDWLGLRQNNAYVVRSLRDVPIFSGLAVVLAILGLLGLTWYREGR